MTGRVTLSGFLRCADRGEADRVAAALDTHIALTRAEAGCISFDVQVTDDPLVWKVTEEFRDRAAFDAHQCRTNASDWVRQTAGITRDYSIEG